MNILKHIRTATIGLIGIFFIWFAANKESLRGQDIIDMGLLSITQDTLLITLGCSLIFGLVLCASYPFELWVRERLNNGSS